MQQHPFIYPGCNGVSIIILHLSTIKVVDTMVSSSMFQMNIEFRATFHFLSECSLGHSPSRHFLNWCISMLVWTFKFPLFSQQLFTQQCCQLPVLQCLL